MAVALSKVLGPDVLDWLTPEGNRVLRERWRRGLRRADAAEQMGVSIDVLARAERGAGVHPTNAKRIADAYGLAVEDVLPVPVEPRQER